jgi:SAM-dependent methyltransferase
LTDVTKNARAVARQTAGSLKNLVKRVAATTPAAKLLATPALKIDNSAADSAAMPAPEEKKGILWEEKADFYNRRDFIAALYIEGEGIEIGALHTPLKVPPHAHVSYVDRSPVEDLQKHYAELGDVNYIIPDIIDDGETLATIADESQNFVIANHFIEHCQDPLKALKNMLRVLRYGGILFLTVPEQRATADFERPATTTEHIIRDHTEGPEWSRRDHFAEFVRLFAFMKKEGEEAERWTEHLMALDYSIHYHVWSQFEFFELIVALKKTFKQYFDVEMFYKNEAEFIFILRKVMYPKEKEALEAEALG